MADSGRVVLVRHGECTYDACGREAGLINSELTDEGRMQVRRCADALSGYRLRNPLVLTSPLERALATARVIARSFSVPLEARWELIERHLGGWTAQRRRDLGPEPFSQDVRPPAVPAAHPMSTQIMDGLHQFLGRTGRHGETPREVAERAGVVWSSAVRHASGGRDVVLVSHDWPLRCLLQGLEEPYRAGEPTPTRPVVLRPAAAGVVPAEGVIA